MKTLCVNLKKEVDNSYVIHIESHGFMKIASDLKNRPIGNQYAIITDSTVRSLYGDTLVHAMTESGLRASIFHFSPGEESKNLEVIQGLTRQLVTTGIDRKSAIIALGGGVVGDIAGFIAATYMRGVAYIQIPTTLLAQVDSSIGGKTAVNLPEGKNLIGSFYQPKRVYMDPLVLTTLPERHFRSGMAEIIKHAVIYDEGLFEYLDQHSKEIMSLDEDTLTHVIFQSCNIKSEIVQKDEKEENLRAILNYGHTLAHAIETCEGYHYLHGEAVSIGMHYAGALAHSKNLWPNNDFTQQTRLLRAFGLPLQFPNSPKKLVKAMYSDKKAEEGRIMFVLPCRIGRMATINGQYRIHIAEEELHHGFSRSLNKNL